MDKKIVLTPDNFEEYRKSAREDLMSWVNAHSSNIRRLDVMIVLVSSAIFYDTTNIATDSCLKLVTQIAAIGTIAFSIIDHGYARFYVPTIIRKAQKLWNLTLSIIPKEMTQEDLESLNNARSQLYDSQKSYSKWNERFSALEIILVLIAILGELVLRVNI